MTEPNKWTVRPYADVGTIEPFLTRISIGLTEILDGTLYDNRTVIRELILRLCFECLIPAFVSLRELRTNVGNDEVPVLTQTKNCEDVYKYLWTAYKDRMQNIAKLMGYDIGFLFQKDSIFEAGWKQFLQTYPEVSDKFIDVVKGNRKTWQSELAKFRNDYLEHRKIDRASVAGFYSLEDAEFMFNRVWIAIEETLVLLIATKLPPSATLREIPESERNPILPKRFGWAWAAPARPL